MGVRVLVHACTFPHHLVCIESILLSYAALAGFAVFKPRRRERGGTGQQAQTEVQELREVIAAVPSDRRLGLEALTRLETQNAQLQKTCAAKR
jgi:hypothetical protein